jgi:hypothetical protein
MAERDRLRELLQRCDCVFRFDLARMIVFGPDYNQAVKDASDALREAIEILEGEPHG